MRRGARSRAVLQWRSMQKHRKRVSPLKLDRETIGTLSAPKLAQVIGASVGISCFPNECKEWESSGC